MRGPSEHGLRLFAHLFRMCVSRTLIIVLFYEPLRCLEDAMSFRLPKSVAHLHRIIYGAHPPTDQNFFYFMGFVSNLGKLYGWCPSFMVDNLKGIEGEFQATFNVITTASIGPMTNDGVGRSKLFCISTISNACNKGQDIFRLRTRTTENQ